jgi:hypothetical protein
LESEKRYWGEKKGKDVEREVREANIVIIMMIKNFSVLNN